MQSVKAGATQQAAALPWAQSCCGEASASRTLGDVRHVGKSDGCLTHTKAPGEPIPNHEWKTLNLGGDRKTPS